MNAKQLVAVGLTFTALFTSLVLNTAIPPLILAGIVLLAGLLATWNLALNRKKMERLEEEILVFKAKESLQEQTTQTAILAGVTSAVKHMVPGASVYLWAGLGVPEQISPPNWPGGEELKQKIRAGGEMLVINREQQGLARYLPPGVSWLMGIPLKWDGMVQAVLCLTTAETQVGEEQIKKVQALGAYAEKTLQKLCQAEETEQFYQEIISALARLGEPEGSPFAGHAKRVQQISLRVGQKLGLDKQELTLLSCSAVLHDIGKAVRLNDTPANTGEQETDHPVLGAGLLPEHPYLSSIKAAILHHHERYNGSGFPEGLSLTQIPFMARIIAVADVYDALTRLCEAEEQIDHQTALKVIKKGTGTLFDPLVVVALEEVEPQLQELTAMCSDNPTITT